MDFELVINDLFVSININPALSPINNKYVLSILNDYEDGKWRYEKFQNFVWDNIAETSLSQAERNALIYRSHSLLTAAAKNLRLTDEKDDIGQGSELAEIVLYGIMKHHYKALPVVPKIFYKQNVQDNAKGADSVHVVLEPGDNFSLWFGEAKFYNDIKDARLPSIVESVGNSLKTDKLKKENSIITNVSDLDCLGIDADLVKKIKSALSNKHSIDELKSKIHIPILLLHECDLTDKNQEYNQAYKDAIVTYHKDRARAYFTRQVQKLAGIFKYSEIKFHIILFPVPSKKTIVKKFVANVKHYKEQ